MVNAAIYIYRSQFRRFLGLAARSIAWWFIVLIPIFFVGLLAGVVGVVGQNSPEVALLGGLVVLVGVGVTILSVFYAAAKSLTNMAAISRLAYNQLTFSTDPPATVCDRLNQYKWSFLWIPIGQGFLFLGISIGVSIFTSIVAIAIPAAVLTAIDPFEAGAEPSLVAGILLFLVSMAYLIAILFVYLWFAGRWLCADTILAVEEKPGAFRNIGRSWDLSATYALRVISIAIVALAVTFPVTAILNYLPTISLGLAGVFLSPIILSSLTFLSYIPALLGSILTIPLWQAAKAVIYYDLRARQEGLDLQLSYRS